MPFLSKSQVEVWWLIKKEKPLNQSYILLTIMILLCWSKLHPTQIILLNNWLDRSDKNTNFLKSYLTKKHIVKPKWISQMSISW